nr:hypothetical protein HK105_006848 [Polyrhizophydium stewartii]
MFTAHEGQLGLVHTCEQATPAPIPDLRGKQVSCVAGGVFHSAALVHVEGQGQIHMWGSNFFGQAGYFPELQSALFSTDDEEVVWEPRWLDENLKDESITALSCGDFHNIALAESGKVFTWGAGILGHGSEVFDSRPHAIKSFMEPEPLRIHSVHARQGLSFATASKPATPAATTPEPTDATASETAASPAPAAAAAAEPGPPTEVFVWGHYDASEDGAKRVKSTAPVRLPTAEHLATTTHVDGSYHMMAVAGTSRVDGRPVFAVFGSHPARRVQNFEPETPPYHAELEKIDVVNAGEAPVPLIGVVDDLMGRMSLPRSLFLVDGAVVVLRENGTVDVTHVVGDTNPSASSLTPTAQTLDLPEPIVAMSVSSPLAALAIGKSGTVYQWTAVYPPKPKPKSAWSWLIDPKPDPAEVARAASMVRRTLLDALVGGFIETRGTFNGAVAIGGGWSHHFVVADDVHGADADESAAAISGPSSVKK